VVTRDALARLPLTRKRDLMELQKKSPPFGGLNSLPRRNASRVFASPGPIYEIQGKDLDPWRMARVFYAAGFRNGDLIHNCFSYHFTPGAFIFEGGARKLGCSVFPGGTGRPNNRPRRSPTCGRKAMSGRHRSCASSSRKQKRSAPMSAR
jgi:phenylacetate-CoA ligase